MNYSSPMLFVLDKPKGPTSFDMVRKIRHMLKIDKVGHAGSLDPFATGVLVLLTGKATKLSDHLLNADKKYEAVIKLGELTDSFDSTGKIIETKEVPAYDEEFIKSVLKAYEGEWMQTPPMFSAKKVNGVKLYELARKNISIERKAAPVELYEVSYLSYVAPYLSIRVHCSKGTYIRSLAEDIGRKLGTVAHLDELRRFSCGAFSLDKSMTLEGLESEKELNLKAGYDNYLKLLRQEYLEETSRKQGFSARMSSRQLPL